jgi:hypothetical protein
MEFQARHAVERIQRQVATTATVIQDGREQELRIARAVATILLEWKRLCPETKGDRVFPSPRTNNPYDSGSLRKKVLKAAALRAKIQGQIGWHTLRHSYRVAGRDWCSSRGAAEINASCQHLNHDEYLRRSLHGSEAQGQYIRRAARALPNSTPPNATRIAKGHHSRWPLSLSLCLLDYFGLELKIQIPRNPMIALVAGGGFEPPTFGL